jgi:hypothetical protein
MEHFHDSRPGQPLQEHLANVSNPTVSFSIHPGNPPRLKALFAWAAAAISAWVFSGRLIEKGHAAGAGERPGGLVIGYPFKNRLSLGYHMI